MSSADPGQSNVEIQDRPSATARAPIRLHPQMVIAYLINQYPAPSQSFIRREVLALEGLGYTVHRFCVRRWAGELVDPADCKEQESTRAILDEGWLRLFLALLRTSVRHPIRAGRAFGRALALSRRADRGLLYHLAYLIEACVLLSWLQASGARHLHAHFGTNSTAVALLTHVLGGPPYSFTVHGPEEFDKPAALHLGEKIDSASFVVAISEFARSQLYRWCSVDRWPRIHIVRCGVDEFFLRGPRLPVPDTPRLISIARLDEQKGHGVLIAAAARLAAKSIPFELVLAGDGPLRPQIESMIARVGLSDRVKLLGWQTNERVRRELEMSRALVIPSFAEGLPVVIMEALALERPVISTFIAGIPELVIPGENGWLVPPGSVEALAAAMQQALSMSADALGALGRSGAARVAMFHRAEANAAVLAALLEATGRGVEGPLSQPWPSIAMD